MIARRYLVMTLDDAQTLVAALRGSKGLRANEAVQRIHERLQREQGADMEGIVQQLKELETCAACGIEGQERSCVVHVAHQQGRRLRRLLERARGERGPGPAVEGESR